MGIIFNKHQIELQKGLCGGRFTCKNVNKPTKCHIIPQKKENYVFCRNYELGDEFIPKKQKINYYKAIEFIILVVIFNVLFIVLVPIILLIEWFKWLYKIIRYVKK